MIKATNQIVIINIDGEYVLMTANGQSLIM